MFFILEQGRHSTKTSMLFIMLAIAFSAVTLLAYANYAGDANSLDINSLGCAIACYLDSDCDDENQSTIDICNNDASCESYCTSIAIEPECAIACNNDQDCDDDNPETIDVCNNDGTCEAECTSIAIPPECEIACSTDADCNDNNPATVDICNNDGTCEAECSSVSVQGDGDKQPIEEMQIPTDFNPEELEEGLAVYYTFNGNSAGTFDYSGKGRHGQYFDDANNYAEGKDGTSAGSFGGGDGHIALPTEQSVGGKLQWTISFWFKTNTIYSNGFYWEDYFVNEGGTSGNFSYVTIDLFPNDWGIWVECYNEMTGEHHYMGCDQPNSEECYLGFDDGQWHHLAWVREGEASWALYLDGELVETDDTSVEPIAASPDFVHLGDGYSGELSTLLEDFKVYDRALSAQEISQQYRLWPAGNRNTEGD